MIPDLFTRYKQLKFNNPITLFEPELWRAKDGICPFCLGKLRKMYKRPFYFCASKKHKKAFIISESKMAR